MGEVKSQQNDKINEGSISNKEKSEKIQENIRERKLQEERDFISNIEKQAAKKIEKTKKENELEVARWQKNKRDKENEEKKKEQQELEARLAEEMRSEELRIQTEKDKEEIKK